jgi:hypothetical protein
LWRGRRLFLWLLRFFWWFRLGLWRRWRFFFGLLGLLGLFRLLGLLWLFWFFGIFRLLWLLGLFRLFGLDGFLGLFRFFGFGRWRRFENFDAFDGTTTFAANLVSDLLRVTTYHCDCHDVVLLIVHLVSNFCSNISRKK